MLQFLFLDGCMRQQKCDKSIYTACDCFVYQQPYLIFFGIADTIGKCKILKVSNCQPDKVLRSGSVVHKNAMQGLCE